MYKVFRFVVNTTIVVLAFVFHKYTVPVLGWISLLVTGATWIARTAPTKIKVIKWDDFDWDDNCKDPECKVCDTKNEIE